MAKQKRMMGHETEYAVVPGDANGFCLFFDKVRKMGVPFYTHGLHNNDFFLSNGARLYQDGNHPEYSTPECDSPFELVRQILDGDLIMQTAAQASDASVMRHNVDYSNRSSWGSHESYMTSLDIRDEDYDLPHAFETILPHLATRIVYTGAGGFSPACLGARFVISPRSAFVQHDVSDCTTGDRGLLNRKDEPLMRGTFLKRLHLVCGESVKSHVSMLLRAGATAIVVRLAEMEENPIDHIHDRQVDVLKKVSRDPGSMSYAIAVQEKYLAAARLNIKKLPGWAGKVCDIWEKTLGQLRDGKASLTVDWAIKKALFDNHARSRGFAPDEMAKLNSIMTLAKPEWPVTRLMASKVGVSRERLIKFGELVSELKEIDAKFGMLGGLFDSLAARGVLSHFVDGVEASRTLDGISPPHGRATVRGDIVKTLYRGNANQTERVSLSWGNFSVFSTNRHSPFGPLAEGSVDLSPFASSNKHAGSLCKKVCDELTRHRKTTT
jgi:proteasome accessory factor A